VGIYCCSCDEPPKVEFVVLVVMHLSMGSTTTLPQAKVGLYRGI